MKIYFVFRNHFKLLKVLHLGFNISTCTDTLHFGINISLLFITIGFHVYKTIKL
jgi:hypothetical protein